MKFKSGQIQNLEQWVSFSRAWKPQPPMRGWATWALPHSTPNPDTGRSRLHPPSSPLPCSLLPLPWLASLCLVLWNEISLESGHSGASGANLTCLCLSSCGCHHSSYHPPTQAPQPAPWLSLHLHLAFHLPPGDGSTH